MSSMSASSTHRSSLQEHRSLKTYRKWERLSAFQIPHSLRIRSLTTTARLIFYGWKFRSMFGIQCLCRIFGDSNRWRSLYALFPCADSQEARDYHRDYTGNRGAMQRSKDRNCIWRRGVISTPPSSSKIRSTQSPVAPERSSFRSRSCTSYTRASRACAGFGATFAFDVVRSSERVGSEVSSHDTSITPAS